MGKRPEVTLLKDGVTADEVEASLAGLALWTIMNQHDIERPDDKALLHSDDGKAFQRIKFDFQQIIDWEEWREICTPRLKYAAKLEIPHLPELLPHQGKMAIVGAGPSVATYIDDIRQFRESDEDNLMSINGAHSWLISNGITPRIHVISEFDLEDVEIALGGPPHKDVYYYIGSCCSESIFRQLKDYKRVIFHPFLPMEGYQHAIQRYFKYEFMVTSGFATFFKSLAIAAVLGFRHFDLFGMDSSFEESSHLDGYQISNVEPKIELYADFKKFTTQGGLAFQAKEFLEFCKFNQQGISLRVHGEGLLRHLHKNRYPEQYEREI